MEIVVTSPGGRFVRRTVKAADEKKMEGPIAGLTDKLDQEILGFGAALTDAACAVLNRLPTGKRDTLLHEIYSPEGAAFNMGRICVGSSDYAEEPYNFAPAAEDMEMERFNAEHDAEKIIPTMKKAREYNPDLFLFSSPWSPPGWMKTSGQMEGGWMREKYLHAFALYYLKFLEYYRDAGVRVNAVTPQNEAETDQAGRMPACLWHPELEMKFAEEMRRLLDGNGFGDVKIWLMDHNFSMWRRACFEMADPEVRRACAGIAWHPYEGCPEMVSWFRAQFPESENHWTEGETIPALSGQGELSYGETAQGFIRGIENGCRSITIWNLALDEEGCPNIGPFDCRGAVEISREGQQIRFSRKFDVLAHFSKFVRRGARRIIVDQTAVPQKLSIAAFRNPDGGKVAVAANAETFDMRLNLTADGRQIPLRIPRDSVCTVLL